MRRKARRGGGRQMEVTVRALGARGDGLAECEGRPLYLPQTLAGDRVLAQVTGKRGSGFKGKVVELLAEGPGRVEAPCPHFGPCGGCSVQHLKTSLYEEWKTNLLKAALARNGLEGVAISPLAVVPAQSRRRAVLAAHKRGSTLSLGFHQRESHEVVDLSACQVLTPGLMALLAPLRPVLEAVLETAPPCGQSADVYLLESDGGLDLLLTSRAPLTLAGREALAAFAEARDVARISWACPGEEPEPVVLRREPKLAFSGIDVVPAPGGFLQPTLAGQTLLIKEALKGLSQRASRALDLFSGCGTFTFALARAVHGLQVHAVEGNEPALAALWQAARRADLAGRVTVERRDLAREPLLAHELEDKDVVLFDPPRVGAKEQAAELAKSPVPHVIAVSCNPATFARDAKVLVDGGYHLARVLPVDQFPWTGHLEMVGHFRRGPV
ncbi:MAG: class I SAM-dependent RNA methyltransferase [Pseudomonadota bacterium]